MQCLTIVVPYSMMVFLNCETLSSRWPPESLDVGNLCSCTGGYAGHTKYSLELIYLLGPVKATATPRLAHEITWCRFVNSRGGRGNNISVDLFMEHLKRTLNNYLLGLGANVSESTSIQISRSLRKLMAVTAHFDSVCGIDKESIYHTCKDASKDLQLVVDELQKSRLHTRALQQDIPKCQATHLSTC